MGAGTGRERRGRGKDDGKERGTAARTARRRGAITPLRAREFIGSGPAGIRAICRCRRHILGPYSDEGSPPGPGCASRSTIRTTPVIPPPVAAVEPVVTPPHPRIRLVHIFLIILQPAPQGREGGEEDLNLPHRCGSRSKGVYI